MLNIIKPYSNKLRSFCPVKKTSTIILLLIIFLALGLRVYGITWGLPNEIHKLSYHPDERNIFYAASNLDLNSLDLNPNYFYYPTFHIYFFVLIIQLMVNELILSSTTILIGRLITAGFGVLSVYLLFLIGKEFKNEEVGLISALFFAIVPIHVVHSHYLTNDVPVTFWVLTSLFCCFKIIKYKNLKWYILAGFTGGLGISTKYTAGLIVLPILTSHFLNLSFVDQKFSIKNTKKIFISLIVLTIIFILTSPYVVLSSFESVRDIAQITTYLNTPNPEWFDTGNGVVYHIRESIYYGIGAALLLLSLYGAVFSFKKNKHNNILLFSFIVPYILWVGKWEVRFSRFILPIIPLLLILAASTLYDLNSKSKTAAILVFLITFSYTIIGTASYERLFVNEDPRDSAHIWMDKSIPRSSKIGLLPTFQSRFNFFLPPINENELIFTWNHSELKERNVDYFILSDIDYRFYLKSEKSKTKYSSEVDFINYLFSGKDYKLEKTFHNPQKFLFIDLSDEYLPHDMKYQNPEILVFKRKLTDNWTKNTKTNTGGMQI